MVSIAITVAVDDKSRLEQLVGAAAADRVATMIVQAGAAEAIAYATGRAVFSTMSELRMFRVFCLLEAGMTLDESEDLVATLFKLSPTGARRVVASTLARYSYELGDGVALAVKAHLEAASWDESAKRWDVRLPVGFARERALELCRRGEEENPVAARGAVYQFPHATFNWLRGEVGLPTKAKPQ